MTQQAKPSSTPLTNSQKWWFRLVFWALLFLSVAGLFQVHGWKRESNINRYLPGHFKKTWGEFQKLSHDFGFSRGLLFVLEAPEGQDVFTLPIVQSIRQVTKQLVAMPGIQSVISLANSPSISKKGDAMVVRPLFPRKLNKFGVAQQKKLRRIALHDPLLRGSLVSSNGRATFIIAFLRPHKKRKQEATVRRALGLIKKIHPKGFKATWGVVGGPFVAPLIEKRMRSQAPTLVGLFLLWTLLMFFFFIPGWRRKGWFVGVSIIALFLGLASHMGWHGGLHGSVHLIPLWIWWVVGLWAMHFPNPKEGKTSSPWLWIGTVMLLVWSVVLAFHPWPLFQRWGWTTAFTLLAILAMVRFVSPPRNETSTTTQAPIVWSSLTKGIGILLILVLGVGLRWLPLGISSLSYTFPLHGLLARGDRMSAQHFGGAVPFFIRYQGDLQDPVLLKSMERVGHRLSQLPGVAPVQSYGVIVRRLHSILNQVPRIPDSRLKISSLAILLEGQPALGPLIRHNNRDGIIQGRIRLRHPWSQQTLLRSIQKALRDIPLRYQEVVWAKASPQLKKKLRRTRVLWVQEGIQLWLKKHTTLSLSALQQAQISKLLQAYLRHLNPLQKTFVLEQTRLHKDLSGYLNSEDCDLELNQNLKQKVMLALFRANLKGNALQKEKVRAALMKALEGTEAGKDKQSIKYAVRSLISMAQRLRKNQQLTALQQSLFRMLSTTPQWARVAASRLRAGGSHTTRARMASLRGELLELHNPHWYRMDKGKQRLKVTHTGLHQLLINLAQDTVKYSSQTAWMLLLASFLACWIMLGSLGAAWQVWLPLPLTWLAMLGLLGWQEVPLDLIVVFFLLFLSGFTIFPSLYLYTENKSPTPGAISHRQQLSRMALWISLPATPLLLTALPPLQHVGLLLIVGPWLALLACLTCQPQKP